MELCNRPLPGADANRIHHCLYVKIGEQKLYHFYKNTLQKAYTVSTSRKPPSCIENSLGTPTGLHAVCEKIGEGAPLGMVFKGRKPVGRRFQDCPPEENAENLITTRILRLQGLEPGHNQGGNCDSYRRYVYIHGTNHEERLGTPDSHGCVLLSNADILELFNAVDVGTRLYIAP